MTTCFRVAVALVIVGLAATGCGGSPGDDATATSTSAVAAASPTSAAAAPAPTAAVAADPQCTLDGYLTDAGLTQTPVVRGDAGAPVVDLYLPAMWESTAENAPETAYNAMVYSATAAPDNPPRILATMVKLTGSPLDSAKVLQCAPGEVRALPQFTPMGPGMSAPLAGYDGSQLSGMYNNQGQRTMVARKTVVIPAPDDSGLYVLMLDAVGAEREAWVLAEATDQIDKNSTITF